MCGIFGIACLNDAVPSSSQLNELASFNLRRGPDHTGFYRHGSTSIGMTRLSINDLSSGGDQPLHNENHNISLVLNGEIYNHNELRTQLTRRGHTFSSHSDAEVVIHLYEEYGFGATQYLDGMFAFALYDIEKSILWIVRDRLGIKPLYYYLDTDILIFSSDLRAVCSQVHPSLDLSALDLLLAHEYVPSDRTLFKSIYNLPPATQLILTNNKQVSISTYWSYPSPDVSSDPLHTLDSIHDRLLYSLRNELSCDVPVGISLSGGIDSTVLAILSRQLYPDLSLSSFTAHFIDKDHSLDSTYARKTASSLGFKHYEISLSVQDYLASWSELVSVLDEPITDSSIVPSYLVAKQASSLGIKVLLNGAGGDEVFGGYPRYLLQKTHPLAFFTRLPSSLQYFSTLLMKPLRPSLSYRLSNPAISYFTGLSGIHLPQLLTLIRSAERKDKLTNYFESLNTHFRPYSPSSLSALDTKTYLPGNILALTDKSSMASSVEVRVPFLDHRLLSEVLSLPNSLRFTPHEPKSSLYRSFKDQLPIHLQLRRKEGFNAPTSRWTHDLRNSICSSLRENPNPLLTTAYDLPKLLKNFSENPNSSQTNHLIHSFFVLNLWLNHNQVLT